MANALNRYIWWIARMTIYSPDPTNAVRSLGYVPGLDGIRAFSIVLVMLAHSNFQLFSNGGIGVSVFFTLSGFLITTLLQDEFASRGRVSFRAFYIRRVFRLFPALYAMLTVVFLYGLLKPELFDAIVSELISAGLYIYGVDWLREVSHLMLYHTWSLAVEEQFYLIWPWLFIPFLRRKSTWVLTIALIAVILVVMLNARAHFLSATIMNLFCLPIFIGCLGAIFRKMWRITIGSILAWLCAAGILALSLGKDQVWRQDVWVSLASLLLIFYLLQNEATLLTMLFTNRCVLFIGKISYGLYVWHLPVFKVFMFDPVAYGFIYKFIVSFMVATFSWYLMEKRMIEVGHQLSKRIQQA